MFLTKRLKLDLEEVKTYFPKLTLCSKNDMNFLKGDLDICDSNGTYWDTFKVIIVIPEKYPYAVPLLFEASDKIKRDDAHHISERGQCCVEFDYKLLFKARSGIKLVNFIREYVYPFFANQLFQEIQGSYANGEYGHYFNGTRQFYNQDLNFENTSIIIKVIQAILDDKLPKRNDQCICGKNKFKNCHRSQVDILKSAGKGALERDLVEFKKLHNL